VLLTKGGYKVGTKKGIILIITDRPQKFFYGTLTEKERRGKTVG